MVYYTEYVFSTVMQRAKCDTFQGYLKYDGLLNAFLSAFLLLDQSTSLSSNICLNIRETSRSEHPKLRTPANQANAVEALCLQYFLNAVSNPHTATKININSSDESV